MKTLFWSEQADYETTCAQMEHCVHQIKKQEAPEQIWYLEHGPVYTCGPKVSIDELGRDLPFPVIQSQRGGEMTFHGPGQRVLYVMVNLTRRGWDVCHYIHLLEQWVAQALNRLNIQAYGQKNGRGLWTEKGKIASIGIKVTSGVTWHGIACNVCNDLAPFQAISPCGVVGEKMASVACFMPDACMKSVDRALIASCPFSSFGV